MRQPAASPQRAAPPQALAQSELSVAVSQYFHGPLPPPDMLALYEEVHPGAAAVILRMAESRDRALATQQAHRHQLENKALDGGQRSTFRGQWMALFLSVLGMVLIAYAATIGQSWVGATAAAGLFGGLAWVFVTGHKATMNELAQKRRALGE